MVLSVWHSIAFSFFNVRNQIDVLSEYKSFDLIYYFGIDKLNFLFHFLIRAINVFTFIILRKKIVQTKEECRRRCLRSFFIFLAMKDNMDLVLKKAVQINDKKIYFSQFVVKYKRW